MLSCSFRRVSAATATTVRSLGIVTSNSVSIQSRPYSMLSTARTLNTGMFALPYINRVSASASNVAHTSSLLSPMALQTMHHMIKRWKSCGIVGLPNVGKSTLFNALTETQLAQASNYPFCTIEPNVANVAVPDDKLEQIAHICGSKKVITSQIKFMDIAGLIKGAATGAGLGNQFLQNIRDVDVILHVVRCFDNNDIIHVDSRIDPVADIQVIETELLLADIQTIEKRLEQAEKGKVKKDSGVPQQERLAVLKKCNIALNAGIALVDVKWTPEELLILQREQLLTAKPMAYVCNVDETGVSEHNKYTKAVVEFVEKFNSEKVPAVDGVEISRAPRAVMRVCSQLEAEASETFDTAEARKEFLQMNSLSSSSLSQVIRTSNELLRSICFYTVGPQEARSWNIEVGTNAQRAAGKIHSDLEKGFICAEVIKPDDYIQFKGDAGVRAAGKLSQEGKTYIVQDQDIIVFKSSLANKK